VAWFEGERLEYWQSDLAVGRRRLVRAPHAPVAVTAETIAGFKRAHLDRLSLLRTPDQLAMIAQELDRALYHHTLPAIGELKLDPDGNTWLGRYSFLPERSTEWEVFNPEGVWLGTVSTPAGLAVDAISATEVIGNSQDADGVYSVRVHRIRKP
jgi:hypothetical protein